MPAPTIEEKVPTENNTTPKRTTTTDSKVTNDQETSKLTSNDMVVEKPKADDALTEKVAPGEEKPTPEEDNEPSPTTDEKPALGSEAPNDGKEVDSPAKETDVVKSEAGGKIETNAEGKEAGKSNDEKPKPSNQAPETKHDGNAMTVERPTDIEGEKTVIAEKLDTSMQPANVEKIDAADKTAQPEKQNKGTSNDDGERPKVTFGAVEEVAIEEDDLEYKPSEEQDAESEEEEDGEIDEGGEPMLDLKGLPQSLTASLLEKGAMNGPLHGPASKGNTDELRALLAKGGEMEGKVDDPDVYRYTALHFACENDKLEVCKLLLEHGADIEASTKMHESKPIHYAAIEGHDEIISFLLEKGADINALTDDNRTPLYQAAMRGHDHCVKLLLEKGADRSLADKDGKKPADVAEKKEIIDLLTSPPAKKRRTGQPST